MAKAKTSHIPCCPNHGEPLEGMGFPMPAKGIGKCPVSGWDFEYEIEVDTSAQGIVKDKFGNLVKKSGFKVKGDDSKAPKVREL